MHTTQHPNERLVFILLVIVLAFITTMMSLSWHTADEIAFQDAVLSLSTEDISDSGVGCIDDCLDPADPAQPMDTVLTASEE